MQSLTDQLIAKFRLLTATSVIQLTIQLVVALGYKIKKAGLSDDEREPAYRFWYKLEELSSDFDFNTSDVEQFGEGSNNLSYKELSDMGNELLLQLNKYPYKEAIEQLATATYLWLLSCDLSNYKENNETNDEAKFSFCKGWVQTMGIY